MEQQILKIINDNNYCPDSPQTDDKNAAKELAEFMAMKTVLLAKMIGECLNSKTGRSLGDMLTELGFTKSEIEMGLGLAELEEFS